MCARDCVCVGEHMVAEIKQECPFSMPKTRSLEFVVLAPALMTAMNAILRRSGMTGRNTFFRAKFFARKFRANFFAPIISRQFFRANFFAPIFSRQIFCTKLFHDLLNVKPILEYLRFEYFKFLKSSKLCSLNISIFYRPKGPDMLTQNDFRSRIAFRTRDLFMIALNCRYMIKPLRI